VQQRVDLVLVPRRVALDEVQQRPCRGKIAVAQALREVFAGGGHRGGR